MKPFTFMVEGSVNGSAFTLQFTCDTTVLAWTVNRADDPHSAWVTEWPTTNTLAQLTLGQYTYNGTIGAGEGWVLYEDLMPGAQDAVHFPAATFMIGSEPVLIMGLMAFFSSKKFSTRPISPFKFSVDDVGSWQAPTFICKGGESVPEIGFTPDDITVQVSDVSGSAGLQLAPVDPAEATPAAPQGLRITPSD